MLSIRDIFLLISDTLSIDCDNEAIIDLMISVNLFSGSFLSICAIFFYQSRDTLSIDCDNEAIIDLMLSINLFSGSFLLIPDKLSTRLDSELDINLKLSINFSLYIVVLPLSCAFLIGTDKVIYFSVFSPMHSKLPLNSFANSLIMK